MHNVFGTDGIRGCVGEGIFVQDQLIILGKSIAEWVIKRYGNTAIVFIARDPRISSHFIGAALKVGMLQYPLTIQDGGILPTPVVAHILKHNQQISVAIIISGSHNTYQDNGIKILKMGAEKLSLSEEHALSMLMHGYEASYPMVYGSESFFTQGFEIYSSLLHLIFKKNFLQGKKIVLDAAHGAFSEKIGDIFSSFGAHVVLINHLPDGYNINKQCGAVYLQAAQEAVIKSGADIGFAFDGDGDRIGVVSRRAVIKNGDDILALLLTHPFYRSVKKVVGTVMTNEGLVCYLREKGIDFVRVPVGDKYIAEYLEKENLILGGEQSGHIILKDLLPTGDGILVALRLIEAIEYEDNWNLDTFEHYPQIMKTITIIEKKNLQNEPYLSIIKKAESELKKGRVVVRYSGTEKVLRILVEDAQHTYAKTVCDSLVSKLSALL